MEPERKWAYNLIWDSIPIKYNIKPKNWGIWYNAKVKDPWGRWNDIRIWYKCHKDPVAYTVDKSASILLTPAVGFPTELGLDSYNYWQRGVPLGKKYYHWHPKKGTNYRKAQKVYGFY